MHRPERPDADKDTTGAPDLEIGAPDLRPISAYRHTAGHDLRILESQRLCLIKQGRFETGRRDKEDFEITAWGRLGLRCRCFRGFAQSRFSMNTE
jgi:hypothetical protein